MVSARCAAPADAADPGSRAPASAPLHGLRIIDLSRYLPGPLATRILADLGAQVLKIEEPKRGDPTRWTKPQVPGTHTSSLSALLLAGHRSVALDLKQAAEREVLLVLLADADVLVESLRPGTLARLGLDPEALRVRFPRLVLCSISGFGQQGPHAQRVGHDLTYQALAGALASRPVPPAVQVADIAGAWSAATAICAALVRRGESGQGCWIDQALSDAAGHAALTAWAEEVAGAKAVGESLTLTGAAPCYNVYATREGGFFALAALEPRFWRRFCVAVDHAAWIPQQFSRDPEIRRQVAALFAAHNREHWRALFVGHELPGEPVLSLSEAREQAQNALRAMVRAGADGLPRLAYPALLDGQRPRSADAVPALGGDTEATLAAHGMALPRWQRRRWATLVRGWLAGLAGRWSADSD